MEPIRAGPIIFLFAEQDLCVSFFGSLFLFYRCIIVVDVCVSTQDSVLWCAWEGLRTTLRNDHLLLCGLQGLTSDHRVCVGRAFTC